MSKLGYDIYLTINIEASNAQGAIVHGGSGEIVENIRISGSFGSLALNSTGIVGIDNSTLNAITLGQLVEGGNASSCVAHAFRVANVTGAEASIVSVMQPVLSQFISKGLSDFLNAAAGAGMDLYLQTLLDALPNLVQEKFRDLLNQAIGKALAKAASANKCTYCVLECWRECFSLLSLIYISHFTHQHHSQTQVRIRNIPMDIGKLGRTLHLERYFFHSTCQH